MIHLLRIELNKLRSFRAFWILTGMYFLGLGGMLLSIQGVFNTLFDEHIPPPMQSAFGDLWDFYSLPDGWHKMSWIASLFNYLLPIVVIIIVSSEFSYKTVRQNIINGMSRAQWMTGKLLLMAFFALASTMVLFLITLFMGLFHSDLGEGAQLFSQMGYILGYFIQTTGYLTLAMLLSILIRNTGVTIGIMTLYSFFLELVIEYRFDESVRGFFPLRAFSNLVKNPILEQAETFHPVVLNPQDLIVSLGYIGLFATLGFWVLKKRDL